MVQAQPRPVQGFFHFPPFFETRGSQKELLCRKARGAAFVSGISKGVHCCPAAVPVRVFVCELLVLRQWGDPGRCDGCGARKELGIRAHSALRFTAAVKRHALEER